MKKIFVALMASLMLVACQSDSVKRAELAYIQINLQNGGFQNIIVEKITPKEIVVIDSVTCDKNGNALIRLIPNDEEMLLLQFSNNHSFIPLIVNKNTTTTVTADFRNIESTFCITDGFESEHITHYFRHLFRDKKLSDSLAEVLNEATISPDFSKIREATISMYNEIYHNHKSFADSMIRNYPAALSNLFILNQSIGKQRLFEMTTDSSLYFLVDDSLTNRYPSNEHVLRNHEIVGNYRTALVVKKMAQQRLSSGNKAPDFILKDIHGQDFSLNSLRGKDVLIIFWASWDGKFRNDLSMLKTMYKDYKNSGFEIVAVSMDEKEKLWKNAVEHQQVSWINVADLKGVHSPLVRMYNLGNELPEYYLIDKEGIIIAQHPSMVEIDDVLYQQRKH